MHTSEHKIMVSCVECRKTFNAHSFHTHLQRIHDKTQLNYTGKTKAASIASQAKAHQERTLLIIQYDADPRSCLCCGEKLPFAKRNNQFCSRACSYSRTGGSKGPMSAATKQKIKDAAATRKALMPQYTKIRQCVICNKYHAGSGASCSSICKKQLLSQSIKRSGYNFNNNRGRGKRSYLERTMFDWLVNDLGLVHGHDFLTEHTFRRHDMIKCYYADFYFPNNKLVIELDGSQHQQTIDYDKNRDDYIQSQYNVKVLRITHKEYVSGCRIPEVVALLKKN